MSLSRLVLALAVALLAAVPSATATPAPSLATIELSAAGQARAETAHALVRDVHGGQGHRGLVGDSSSSIGTLRFKSGRRSVSATSLTLTVGRTSSYVSARLGRKTVRLFTVTPTRPAQLDPALSTVDAHRRTDRADQAGRQGAAQRAQAQADAVDEVARQAQRRVRSPRAPSSSGTARARADGHRPRRDRHAGADRDPHADRDLDRRARRAPATRPACPPRPRAASTGSAATCPAPVTCAAGRATCSRPRAGCSLDPGTIVASGGASRLISNSAYDHRFADHAGPRTTSPAAATLYLSGHDHVLDARPRHRRADHEPGDRDRPGRAHRHGPRRRPQRPARRACSASRPRSSTRTRP